MLASLCTKIKAKFVKAGLGGKIPVDKPAQCPYTTRPLAIL